MPNLNGIDLVKKLRQISEYKELPIIMVTTQDEDRDNKAAYAAGINGIVQKPFSEGQIGKALKLYAGMLVSH